MRLEPDELDAIAAALAPRIAELLRDALPSPSAPPADEMLTVAEAAQVAHLSTATIRRAYRLGWLRAERPAGSTRVLIRASELRTWLRGDQAPPGAKRRPTRRPSRPSGAARASLARRSAPASDGPGSLERLRELEREYDDTRSSPSERPVRRTAPR